MRVIVIGSGLLGLSTAYYLVRRGIEVTVIERREGPGLEASFANGSILTASMSEPWNSPTASYDLLRWLGRENTPLLIQLRALPAMWGWAVRFLCNSTRSRFDRNTIKNVRLILYSMQKLSMLRCEAKITYEERSVGTLRIFRDVAALGKAVKRADFLGAHGVAFQVLDVAGVIALEPALANIAGHLAGGIHYGSDETGNARLFCNALAAAVQRAGGRFLFGTAVNGWRVQGRCIGAVLTAGDALIADAFVLAAGSYSAGLARQIGLNVPVRPAKGYSVTIPAPTCGPQIPVVDDELHAAVVPVGASLRVVGTAEFAGFDLTLTPARISALLRFLDCVYPEIYSKLDRSAALPWAGLRPMSADGVPILGSTPIENLYLNTGHGHLGWSMAAGSGRAVADLIAGAAPEIDLDDYSLARF